MIDYSIWDDDAPADDTPTYAEAEPTPDINFDAIKLANPIAQVVGQVVALKRSGREHKGLCPFHKEKNPSFTVYEDRAHCFGCGWDGDVIQFVQDIEGLGSPIEAAKRLTGGDIPQMTPALRRKMASDKARREEKQALEQAKARLKAQRRWDAAEPIDLDNPPHYLLKKGLSEHPPFLKREGLNLLLPLHDDEGDILSVQAIRPDSAKRFHPGARTLRGRLVLGVNFGRVIICEGYATGASIWESTAECVCVAFSKANIHELAREYYAQGIAFVIAADTGAVAEMQDVARETGHPLVVAPECGSDFNDQHLERGADSVRATFAAALKAHAAEVASAEEEPPSDDAPIDLWATYEPPALPRGLLPKVIEDFAFVQAEVMGADPGGLAMAALACAGSMIHDDVRLKVKRHERWTESARIWVALVGGPSVLKSPVMRVAGSHIGSIDTGRVIEHNKEKQRWMADKAGGMKDDPPPPPERLRINDTTVEAAQEILKTTNRGILCVQDELAGWFASMERNGKGGDNSFWLQAFNGGHFSVDRVGRGSVAIENLSVSLVGGIQPDKIRQIMKNAPDDGIMQRFFPIVLREGGYDMDVETPDVRDAYEEALDALYALQPPDTILGPQPLEFSDPAQEFRSELAKQHVDMQRALAQVDGKLASHVGKYNGLFGRLCIIWHCLEHVTGSKALQELPKEIGVDTARKVADFLHGFLLAHLKAFYHGIFDLSDELDLLRDLASYIIAHGKESVTMRDLQRSTRKLRSLNRFEGAKVFEAMEAMGWLDQTNKRSDAPQWAVNPAVHGMYAERGEAHKERAEQVRKAIRDTLGKP